MPYYTHLIRFICIYFSTICVLAQPYSEATSGSADTTLCVISLAGSWNLGKITSDGTTLPTASTTPPTASITTSSSTAAIASDQISGDDGGAGKAGDEEEDEERGEGGEELPPPPPLPPPLPRSASGESSFLFFTSTNIVNCDRYRPHTHLYGSLPAIKFF
jgi:hypothetical protein